jgi:hypothetical protein
MTNMKKLNLQNENSKNLHHSKSEKTLYILINATNYSRCNQSDSSWKGII